MVPGLLFANDTPLVASDKEGLEKSFDVVVKWCEEGGGGKNHNVEVRHNAYEEENGGV